MRRAKLKKKWAAIYRCAAEAVLMASEMRFYRVYSCHILNNVAGFDCGADSDICYWYWWFMAPVHAHKATTSWFNQYVYGMSLVRVGDGLTKEAKAPEVPPAGTPEYQADNEHRATMLFLMADIAETEGE